MQDALQVLPVTDADLDEQALDQKVEIDAKVARMKASRPAITGDI